MPNDRLNYENSNGADFGIPSGATSKTFTYVAAGAADDDKVQTITYKAGTKVLGVLTLTYIGSTNNIETMTRTT